MHVYFQVEVDALESGRKYRFPCGQWLATDEGDGTTYRYLYPLHAKSNTKKRVSSRAGNTNYKYTKPPECVDIIRHTS